MFLLIKEEKTMNEDKLNLMRHGLAHITAAAVQKLWPEAKFGVGPTVDNGFYYDIDLGETKISDVNFAKIEKEMRRIIDFGADFEKSEMSIDQAITWAKDNNQPYKEELLNDLKRSGTTIAKDLDIDELGLATEGRSAIDKVTFYKLGKFMDLCRGPHLKNTKEITGAFKLMRVAGAYWRGKETNPQMQRLYGIAFASQAELDDYAKRLEKAKLLDHRKLNQELDLYHIDEEVGNGLVLWHPRGALLWLIIESYWYNKHLKNGYELVRSPHIGSRSLWEKSGHWGFYSGSMYPPLEVGQSLEDSKISKKVVKSEQYLLKPMNCPFHVQIYNHNQRSYRELPFRWAEMGDVYRFEKTGELSGLTRVRGFTQDDAHIICRKDQVKDELKRVIDFILEIYEAFGFDQKSVNVYLSLRDSNNKDKYAGDDAGWEFTERVLREVTIEKGLEYKEEKGEAAFYGPKLDFKINDVIGREWQCSTLQFDFNLPKRFNMTFTNESSKEEQPYMLHRALFGSMERFIGLLIENYGGAFPLWLAPEQIRILTINNEVGDYVNEIEEILNSTVLMKPVKYNEIRYKVDDRNESLGKKIREASNWKIPIQLIIGPKDKDAREVSVRTQSKEEKIKIDKLADYLEQL
jgi:threonyl-tRNA synthetase